MDRVYDLESLTLAMRELEDAYGIASATFYERYVADDLPAGVRRFDAHVWASFIEDVRRLGGEEPPIERVMRTFAHT